MDLTMRERLILALDVDDFKKADLLLKGLRWLIW
jgi:orotidine-5'-phosphate decarboxylase